MVSKSMIKQLSQWQVEMNVTFKTGSIDDDNFKNARKMEV